MLKILVKKQLMEVFKGYFYDSKKNKGRSKAAIVGYFIFFVVIMIGLLGGMFTMLSLSLAGSLSEVGLGWLYFFIMSLLAVFLGVFGSVFNTYASLYEGKDNDLLLSMPIPVADILGSRLINVLLLGAMYSLIVIVPAEIVYWVLVGASLPIVVGGIVNICVVTLFVFVLTCLLGWVVAQISKRLKNKSFITVILSLGFLGLYYFFYFKAEGVIQYILANAMEVGEKIKGSAYFVYFYGSMGTGSALSMVVCAVVVLVLTAVVLYVMNRTFISVVTATSVVKKAVYKEKKAKQKSIFGAVLAKEAGRFLGSATYMLNAGLGIVMLVLLAVAMFIKGRDVVVIMNEVFGGYSGMVAVILGTVLMVTTTLVFVTAPSVSMEGKSLWILQSLPVEPKLVLRAKLVFQLILTLVPLCIATVAAMFILDSPLEGLLVGVVSMFFAVYHAAFGLMLGLKMPNLNWTNESMVVKQGGAVLIASFGNMAVVVVFMVPYLLWLSPLGAVIYLAIWAVVFAIASVALICWLEKKGVRIFAGL